MRAVTLCSLSKSAETSLTENPESNPPNDREEQGQVKLEAVNVAPSMGIWSRTPEVLCDTVLRQNITLRD